MTQTSRTFALIFLRVPVLLGVSVLAIGSASAQSVSFYHGKIAYPAIGTVALATGDFNGDGEVDALAASQFAISVYPGNANGSFGAPITTTLKASCASSLLVTDFNADGKLDFACLLSGAYQVALGNGDGTFKTPILTSVNGIDSLNVGDFNGDGIPDLVSYTPNSVLVFLGLGDGLFLPPVLSPVTQGSFTSLHPADVNGDGLTDLVATRGDAILLLFGRGDGSFGVPMILVLKANTTDSVTAADLNGDGTIDLVVGINKEATNLPVPHLAVLLQGPHGNFQTNYYSSLNPLTELQVADLNGDGLPDISGAGVAIGVPTLTVFKGSGKGLLASPVTYDVPVAYYRIANPRHEAVPDVIYSDGNTVSLLPNDGTGHFTTNVQVEEGKATSPCVAGDFDNDGLTDLACLDSYAITILYGTGSKTQPFGRSTTIDMIGPANTIIAGDFNGDGNLDLEAALVDGTLQFIENLGAGGFSQPAQRSTAGPGSQVLGAGDFNGDGKLDLLTGGGNFLAGNGDGSFQPHTSFYSGNFEFFGVADLNRDGVPDVVGIPGGELPPVILLGLGGGQFAATILTTVNGSYQPVIADLNGDGLPDIAIPAARFGVTILLNNGSGVFANAPAVFNDFWPPAVSVAIADLNADGKPDLVFGIQNMSVWPVIGNGDGTFQSSTTGISVEDATNMNVLATGSTKPTLAVGSTVISVLTAR